MICGSARFNSCLMISLCTADFVVQLWEFQAVGALEVFADPGPPQVVAVVVFILCVLMFSSLALFSLTNRARNLAPAVWEVIVVVCCMKLFLFAALFDFRYMAKLFEWEDPWPGYEMRTDGHLVMAMQGVFSCIPLFYVIRPAFLVGLSVCLVAEYAALGLGLGSDLGPADARTKVLIMAAVCGSVTLGRYLQEKMARQALRREWEDARALSLSAESVVALLRGTCDAHAWLAEDGDRVLAPSAHEQAAFEALAALLAQGSVGPASGAPLRLGEHLANAAERARVQQVLREL